MITETKNIQKKPIEDFTIFDLEKFSEVLKYHNDLYYNKSEPIISDGEYDELLKKMQTLEVMF